MKRKGWVICGAGAALMAAAVLAVSLGGRGEQVETAEVIRTSAEDSYTEEGVLSAGDTCRILSEVSGPVKEILVSENQQVKAGDVLYIVDSSEYEYARAQAQAALEISRAQMESGQISRMMTASPGEYLDSLRQSLAAAKADCQAAETVYTGNQALYAAGSVSRLELEQSRAAYEAAKASMEQAESRLEESSRYLEGLQREGITEDVVNSRFYSSEKKRMEAEIDAGRAKAEQLADKIEKCTVRASQDGIVAELALKEQSAVREGETAAVLRTTGNMTAEADILTSAAAYIKEGDRVLAELSLRGGREYYEGTVAQVYQYAEKGSSALGLDEYRVHVIVQMDENPVNRDGYGVDLTFRLYRNEDCLTVPASAVFRFDGQDYVYRMEHGKAVKTAVTLEYKSGNLAVVSEGLKEGELVVENP